MGCRRQSDAVDEIRSVFRRWTLRGVIGPPSHVTTFPDPGPPRRKDRRGLARA